MRDLGPLGSSMTGTACARALITMSIGLSSTLSIDSIGCVDFWLNNGMAVRFRAFDVMSASGLLCRRIGSGDSGGSGVAFGGNDGTADDRLLRDGAALFRFRGDAFFEGEAGSLGAMLSSGSNISVGSIPSLVFVRLARADFFGEG